MAEDRRLLTVEQIGRALVSGAGTTVLSESGHGWTLKTVKLTGKGRDLRLRFEAVGTPVSQVMLLTLAAGPSCEPTALVDD